MQTIKTNVAASTTNIQKAIESVNVNKNGNGYEQSLEKAVADINALLGSYANHATITKQDFLKLRVRVALAYQDIREFRNASDRFFIPPKDKTKVDKQVTAKWFEATFKMVKPKKAATQKVVETYNNRKNGIKNALSDVRACYAKGLRFEVVNGVPYVTGESYAKHMEVEKHDRVEVTLMQSAKSVTFSQLAAKDDNGEGSGSDSVSVATVTKEAFDLRKHIEAATIEKMDMTQRLTLLDLMFAVQTALQIKHDESALKQRDELVKITKAAA